MTWIEHNILILSLPFPPFTSTPLVVRIHRRCVLFTELADIDLKRRRLSGWYEKRKWLSKCAETHRIKITRISSFCCQPNGEEKYLTRINLKTICWFTSLNFHNIQACFNLFRTKTKSFLTSNKNCCSWVRQTESSKSIADSASLTAFTARNPLLSLKLTHGRFNQAKWCKSSSLSQ